MTQVLRVLQLGTDMTDADLGKMTAEANIRSVKENAGCYWCVRGFDNDARELWEVPEVLALIERADSFGFMSALDCNVDLKRFSEPRLLGAFDFWLFRTRQIHGQFAITRDTIEQWKQALMESNARAQDTMDRASEFSHGNCFAKEIA